MVSMISGMKSGWLSDTTASFWCRFYDTVIRPRVKFFEHFLRGFMEVIQQMGLMVDTILTILVISLAIKTSKKSPATASANPAINTQEIEQSLRKILEDAEESSADLNRELQKRQRALEQLLFDLESVEQRAAKLSGDADSKTRMLQAAIQAASSVEIGSPKKPATPKARSTNNEIDYLDNKIEVLSDDTNEEEAYSEAVNVFGEPIGGAKQASRNTLASKIEVQRSKPSNPAPKAAKEDDVRANIYKIYDQAKDLLSAGRSIAEVCALTQLPSSTVEKIEMLVNEKREEEAPKIPTPAAMRDSRLGALGNMRRSRETV